MARTKKERCINCKPECILFKPNGTSWKDIEKIDLFADEYEAIRLADIEWMSMEKGAKEMQVSAATFYRILRDAHKKLADAIINTKAIQICKTQE